MGHVVTIEAGPLPCVDLPKGVRKTVEVTPHIRRLVNLGAAVVVAGDLNPPQPVPKLPPVADPDEAGAGDDEPAPETEKRTRVRRG